MSFDGFPFSEIPKLELMGRDRARVWMTNNYPQITDDEREKFLINLIPENKVRQEHVSSRKRVTVLFLCGASLRQIASLYQVTPQTISDRIDRELGMIGNRTHLRLAPPSQSFERVAELVRMFDDLVRDVGSDGMKELPAMKIARVIMKMNSTAEPVGGEPTALEGSDGQGN